MVPKNHCCKPRTPRPWKRLSWRSSTRSMSMHPKMTIATTRRVLLQLSHDPRTIGLLFVVPVVLIGLLAWVYSDTPLIFDMIGAPLLGIFPFIVMFLITSVTTLRERSSG